MQDEKKQEKGGYGRWLGFTLAGTLALLAAFGAVTVVVDPFFHYHGPLKELAYPIDSERYQNDGISRHFTYDAVLTGTSMTENFKSSLFDSLFEVRSIKIPFGGGYYKEVDEAVRRALAYNPDTRIVFRSLDKSFLMYDKDAWNPTAPVAEYLTDNNPWNDVNYIWNKEVIFGNIRGVLNLTKSGGRTTTFDEYMHWAPEREWGKEAVLKTYGRQSGNLPAVEFTEEDRQRLAENLEQNVLATAKANPQVTFYCLIPPYSIGYWDSELIAKGGLERELKALRMTAEMLLECDNIRLFAFDDKFDIICNLDNYMDVIHYSEEVGDQLLVWMAQGENLLTRENAEVYFNTITEFYTNYDYESIYE
ncbi:MAG: hypothetical protein LIP16_01730 [Clostridium sp.]|nr:hypothetical protein [Clostridium sp.]